MIAIDWNGVLILISYFALRLLVPIVLMVLLSIFLRRVKPDAAL